MENVRNFLFSAGPLPLETRCIILFFVLGVPPSTILRASEQGGIIGGQESDGEDPCEEGGGQAAPREV